jgi:hypothetical protein
MHVAEIVCDGFTDKIAPVEVLLVTATGTRTNVI